MKKLPQCEAMSPISGLMCTMGKNHFGCHKVGGPYHTKEEFIIPCQDKEHDFYPHDDGTEGCIYCGFTKTTRQEAGKRYKSLVDIVDDELQSIYSDIEMDVVKKAIIEYCHLHKQEIAMFIIERENE